MKCLIVQTGEIKHFPNNDNTAHTLIKAGVLRLIETEPGDLVKMPNGIVIPKMEPPAEPKWSVAMVAQNGNSIERIPAIIFEVGSTIYERFCGEPKQVKTAWAKRVVPAEIVAQYTKLHKEHYRGR
jgi:hypothetical protein